MITQHVIGLSSLQAQQDAKLKSWQRSPEIPTAEELTRMDPPPLPGAVPAGQPISKDEYLETQYRLQRYEGTELLRRAVTQFRDHPEMLETSETYIYSQVRITSNPVSNSD